MNKKFNNWNNIKVFNEFVEIYEVSITVVYM